MDLSRARELQLSDEPSVEEARKLFSLLELELPASFTDRDVADLIRRAIAPKNPYWCCLPLERTGEHGVCVHIWSDRLVSALPTTSTTHAHSWDLLSFVLHGRLRNEEITVTDAPEAPTNRVFEIDSRGEVDEVPAHATPGPPGTPDE